MRHHLAPLVAAWAVLALPVLAEDAIDFKIVVPADHPATSLPREELAMVFTHKVPRWEDGTSVAPVDQEAESPVREAFTRAIHGKSVTAMQSFWQRMVYANRGAPPPVVVSDEEVLAFLLGEPGSVGYVAAATPLDARFRVLDVPDVAGYDAAALSGRGPGGTEIVTLEDVTVGQHGDLRLFLTGSCGPADEGRQAVLENANDQARIEAVIETSVWADGWFRASSVSRHALAPLAEERLGCTHRTDGERRYAIVEVSNASSFQTVATDLGHGGPGHASPGHDGPARDAIAIVGSGTCGSDRRGERRSVINRHPWYEISVSIETREMVDGAVKRRYQKSYRLGPGDTKGLGCSADGKMVRQHTLLEAEYR